MSPEACKSVLRHTINQSLGRLHSKNHPGGKRYAHADMYIRAHKQPHLWQSDVMKESQSSASQGEIETASMSTSNDSETSIWCAQGKIPLPSYVHLLLVLLFSVPNSHISQMIAKMVACNVDLFPVQPCTDSLTLMSAGSKHPPTPPPSPSMCLLVILCRDHSIPALLSHGSMHQVDKLTIKLNIASAGIQTIRGQDNLPRPISDHEIAG